jgi:NAD/NADP transhydrogenase beta subunit
MGHALNKIWGIDKILLGIIVGSVIFFSGAISYGWLKRKNSDKAYFPFQKIIMPVLSLIILSMVFWLYSRICGSF